MSGLPYPIHPDESRNNDGLYPPFPYPAGQPHIPANPYQSVPIAPSVPYPPNTGTYHYPTPIPGGYPEAPPYNPYPEAGLQSPPSYPNQAYTPYPPVASQGFPYPGPNANQHPNTQQPGYPPYTVSTPYSPPVPYQSPGQPGQALPGDDIKTQDPNGGKFGSGLFNKALNAGNYLSHRLSAASKLSS